MNKPKNSKKDIIEMLLSQNNISYNEEELIDLLNCDSIILDVDKKMLETSTWQEKLADKITKIAGSWKFIGSFSLFIIGWMLLNVFILKKVDPYPFILLNLLLSCISSLQAPIIMMSQNRAAKKESIRNKKDYQTDLKSEILLEELYNKLNIIIKNQKKILKNIKE